VIIFIYLQYAPYTLSFVSHSNTYCAWLDCIKEFNCHSSAWGWWSASLF